jgi:Secretion system C-terminal sorting domain
VNNPGAYGYVPPIINVARISAFSDAGVKSTDDGTAILEPMGGPLPVTLKTFSANLSAMNVVKLNWSTTMEINCRSYTIERGIDGKIFMNAGTVAGSGNTNVEKNYFFNDDVTAVKNNTVYYRLMQTDLDGRNSYSKIISIRLKTSTNGFTVSPNPFISYVNINVDWSKNETANVKVISMSGKELVSKNIQLIKGTNYVALNELTQLPAGMYILQVSSTEGSIIKQVSKQ